jgi:sulfite reductase (ferredoxin)
MSTEDVKAGSRQLRGSLAEELERDSAAFEEESSRVLLKFHGIYQQDDRDVRRERAQRKLPLDYSCMVRAAVPGGELTAEQWQALDRLADLADGTMRLTTRQGVQFHVVNKGELRELVHGINAALLTTLAACGDVVRNIMGCPWPDDRQAVLRPLLRDLVARFRPRTTAYWELWIDGAPAVTAEPAHLPLGVMAGDDAAGDDGAGVEPLYGDTYLPRKFKIAVAWPGDNCVDVLANDVGLVPVLSDGLSGDVTGYMVFVGGGLGMSHAREEDTYPRLATPLGLAAPAQVVDAVEAIVATQRDFGNRVDRQRARLKYLVDERGTEWFRAEVERRLGYRLGEPVDVPPFGADDHHGTRDGVVGVPVPSGRVADREGVALRTALRELTGDGTVSSIRVTARQDLLLHGVAPGRVGEVEDRLRAHGVRLAGDVSALRRLAIACPALPTCGQALGEAERVLPELVDELEKELAEAGRGDLAVRLNMTGCPNGCARPYSAEIGVVGRGKRSYDLYVGGSPGGERLGRRIRTDVPLDQIAATLRPVFERFDGAGSFGDWAHRVGAATIETWLPEPTVRRRTPRPAASASPDSDSSASPTAPTPGAPS